MALPCLCSAPPPRPYVPVSLCVVGTTVAGGLFIPSLLTGAAGGRLVGQLLNQAMPNHVVNAGVYSFIGTLPTPRHAPPCHITPAFLLHAVACALPSDVSLTHSFFLHTVLSVPLSFSAVLLAAISSYLLRFAAFVGPLFMLPFSVFSVCYCRPSGAACAVCVMPAVCLVCAPCAL